MYLLLETALSAAALVLALLNPNLFSRLFRETERILSKVGSKRRLAVLVVGATALALRLAVLSISPIPEPIIHDEFGHLLIADTLLHGRVTNPTHPLWVHFESFSIIERPTYQGFAQPAQGLLLAAGKLIGGHPFWGVWFSLGLLCAAICWMLQAWLPPQWALLGGLFAAIRLTTFGYWGNSYWGGALGATAGALVLGAMPRVMAGLRRHHAVILGIGVLLLAYTRPFEGFVFCLPVAFALTVWLVRLNSPELRTVLSRFILPIGIVLAVGFAVMGYYFWRVTGSPSRMPYQVHEAQYAMAPYFIWRSPHPEPVYYHAVLKSFYKDHELLKYTVTRTFTGLLRAWIFRAWVYWSFYLGPALTIPLLLTALLVPVGIRWSDCSERLRFLILIFVVSILALASEIYTIPHYAAPLTSVVYAFVLLALHYVRRDRWHGKPTGVFITRAIGGICIVLMFVRIMAVPLHLPQPNWWAGFTPDISKCRGVIQAELAARPGQHLVIVRYTPDHNPDYEWVYNAADIDQAKIVWARDMGDDANKELFDYYKYRDVWIAEPDKTPPSLTFMAAKADP
jgi:hypothetical protein